MNTVKLTNTSFSFEAIGFDVLFLYDGTSGFLRTINKSDGHIIDTRQLQHNIDFDEFKMMMEDAYLGLVEGMGEGNIHTARDLSQDYVLN